MCADMPEHFTWRVKVIFDGRRGGGQVVSVLAFLSDDPSSNPAVVYSFFCKMCVAIDWKWAGALVEWLLEESHIPKVVGSNPSHIYWMDIFHIYLL